MKCLSVRNPLSYLIIEGGKDVENRTWNTDYRGKILIHSSGRDCDDIYDSFLTNPLLEEIYSFIKSKEIIDFNSTSKEYQKLARLLKKSDEYIQKNKECYFKAGYIIGEVNLIDIIKDSKSKWAIKDNFHWILDNPVLYEKPIKAKGKLGLFEVNI